MRTIVSILAFAVAVPTFAPIASAAPATKGGKSAAATQVRAILVYASNKKGGVDRRLAAYADNLKRNLPFDTFRFGGEGASTLSKGGHATITFAGDHRVELQDDPGDGLRLKAYWMKSSEVIISTTLTLVPGVPGVLVRRGAGDGEVPVVLLIAR
ncbi:MAG: hypothetical protein JNL39_01835 [Opitutaceae bacterium]|nr:hypothetical protein [Opitutaceae bacterium]